MTASRPKLRRCFYVRVTTRWKRFDGALACVVETDVAKFGMVGRFGPRDFTRDAEHRGHGVIAKRHDSAVMLPAGTGHLDKSLDQCVN